MPNPLLIAAVAAVLTAQSLPAQSLPAQTLPAQTLPQGAALTSAIAERDAAMFTLFFDRCDPAALSAIIAPDFEMYHDRDGVVATSGEQFVAIYAKSCAAKKAPDAWRSRRELVTASLNVHPVPGYGAIEDGEHVFYERRGDGPEHKAGTARFTQLWRLAPGGWQLARVFSYGHKAAEAAPPS
jgi:hypothetical protein